MKCLKVRGTEVPQSLFTCFFSLAAPQRSEVEMLKTNCNTTILANLTSDLQNVMGMLTTKLRRWFSVRGFIVGVAGASYWHVRHLLASLIAECLPCLAASAIAKRQMFGEAISSPSIGSPSISPAPSGMKRLAAFKLDRRQLGLAGCRAPVCFSRG